MPKFRNFYRTSPEISTFFSLFSYSVSWQGRRGPFPGWKTVSVKKHGHLVIRCFPARQVFGRLRAGLFVLVSRFVYIKNYLAAPFGHCHNLISSSNHLELKSNRLWNHVVQQRVTALLNELGTWLEDCVLVIRCFPARQVFGRLRAGLFVLVSRFVYIKNYLAAPFGHCHNLNPPAITSNSNLSLWNHVVQQRVTALLNELGMRVFWGTPHTCPNWKKKF